MDSTISSASARQEFMNLLVTQLRNQDPLEPLDTEKFTEQLVQFAGVEQSIQTNQHLEALLALQTASSNETALAMVGRIASVESDVATLTSESARWTYELPTNAAASNVAIVDARGAVVAARPSDVKPPTPSGSAPHAARKERRSMRGAPGSTPRRVPRGLHLVELGQVAHLALPAGEHAGLELEEINPEDR